MSGKANKVMKRIASPQYITMAVEAIVAIKAYRKGVSRAAIANYIVSNYNKESGAHFNAFLRNALKKGIADGLLKYGETTQRYKIGEKQKPKSKKKKVVKRKVVKKRKRVVKSSRKKKTVASRKRKPVSKKRKTANKKKTSRRK